MAETSRKSRFGGWFGRKNHVHDEAQSGHAKWSMGVLNDPQTVEVPGSVLLLRSNRNEPLGLRNTPARNSHSSIPNTYESPTPSGRRPSGHTAPAEDKKMTKDGTIILEPQPESSANDPLNWPSWRRDLALLSLGFYCMVGGGLTPILAAGFYNVSDEYGVDVEEVSLTTGLYMMGMGLGCVIASPTAILYGKRPVYLASAILFLVSSIWCAVSPNFGSLVAARIFQGVAVSPVECLPSATIAEIYFLHERAFRIGIYTLLLLGGKNLVPLISAAIIQSLGWRWVFWIVAFIGVFGFVILFLFVPETFWDRTPHPKSRRPSMRPSFIRRLSSRHDVNHPPPPETPVANPTGPTDDPEPPTPTDANRPSRTLHVGFAPAVSPEESQSQAAAEGVAEGHTMQTPEADGHHQHKNLHVGFAPVSSLEKQAEGEIDGTAGASQSEQDHQGPHSPDITPAEKVDAGRPPATPTPPPAAASRYSSPPNESASGSDYFAKGPGIESENGMFPPADSDMRGPPKVKAYTHNLRHQPPKSFAEQLKPWNGRLNHDKWFKVMLRPFILFAYPPVLWSTAIYSCSVGWLIVISNTMSMIYRASDSYNFTAFQTGLVYLSPFIGGILGTAVAGKVSDVIVKAMARRNGGLYEPEFRLVMAIPILITTVIGLMGFGWSAEERNHYMVPTVFFGIVSFGCSLGSTTSITFCVDSYRQYAGEALVTLNFSKNILHGLIFSLFVTHWMAADGPKTMYIWLGVIQLILCLFSIPMYIYGKRARMWTLRKNLMEKF